MLKNIHFPLSYGTFYEMVAVCIG